MAEFVHFVVEDVYEKGNLDEEHAASSAFWKSYCWSGQNQETSLVLVSLKPCKISLRGGQAATKWPRTILWPHVSSRYGAELQEMWATGSSLMDVIRAEQKTKCPTLSLINTVTETDPLPKLCVAFPRKPKCAIYALSTRLGAAHHGAGMNQQSTNHMASDSISPGTVKSESQLRRDICVVARWLYERSFSVGTQGNLSVRLENSRVLATPLPRSYKARWRPRISSSPISKEISYPDLVDDGLLRNWPCIFSSIVSAPT